MGGSKGGGTTTTTNISSGGTSSTVAKPTAEERALQKLELQRRKNVQPQLLQTDKNLLNLLMPLTRGQLLTGTAFGEIGQGISPESQQRIVQESLRMTSPQFQQLGLLDSGVRFATENKLAANLLTQAEMERQRQLESLLGFITGAPGQAQQPLLNETALLSARLAGLRPTRSTYSSTGVSRQFTPSQGGGGFFSLF